MNHIENEQSHPKMSTSTRQLLADMERHPKGCDEAIDRYLAQRRQHRKK